MSDTDPTKSTIKQITDAFDLHAKKRASEIFGPALDADPSPTRVTLDALREDAFCLGYKTGVVDQGAMVHTLQATIDRLAAELALSRMQRGQLDIDRPIDDTIPAPERPDAVRKRYHGRRFSFGAPRWPGVAKLNEECGEVGQVIGKMMNFDYDSVLHWDGTNLRDALMDEMGDVQAAIAFVTKHCDLDADLIAERARGKLALFEQWHVEQADTIATPIGSAGRTIARSCERCAATMRQVENAAYRSPCPVHGTTAWDDEIERDKARFADSRHTTNKEND